MYSIRNISMKQTLNLLLVLVSLILVTNCTTNPTVQPVSVLDHSVDAEVIAIRLEADEAMDYISEGSVGDETCDIPLTLAAIEKLDKVLTVGLLSERDVVQVRYWRAYASQQVSYVRYRVNNEEFNQAELDTMMADYDYVLASDYSDSYGDAGYYAGMMANSYLHSDDRAAEYWLQCAAINHAGCINIVAFGYFSGIYSFEVSVQDSINFHSQVFDTGNIYQCAGSYSGLVLAKMASFLPAYTYRESWRVYISESLALQSILVQKLANQNACNHTSANITAFLLHLAHGERKPAFLEKVMIISEDEADKAMAKYFLGAEGREAYTAIRRQSNGNAICHDLLNMIFYSQITGQVESIAEDVEEIRASDGCVIERAWLRELKL